ncbi:fimbria/pilus outer membrane usher protein [Erwinia aphidicola]|jgi:outer membrane usher protein|uniref:Fimbria/pilus outer membrane usher protein n=1 Tax=Erwinia aphidicola TaxID=68334 RepID=A0ABU8DEK9_ERWAP
MKLNSAVHPPALPRRGKISTLCILIAAALNTPAYSAQTQDIATNVEFDPSFLNLENKSAVDLSRFANGASATPGTYRVSINLNGAPIGNEEVTFKARANKSVYPCLTAQLLQSINFNEARLPKDFLTPVTGEDGCLDLQARLPESRIEFDSNEQQLNISIPQVYLLQRARGSVNPALWDKGVTAAMLGYNLSGYNSSASGYQYQSMYAGINAGLNVGAWYFRHNGSFNATDHGGQRYDAINSYLQRDIPGIKGRFLAGQSNTQGQLFDTLSFSGVQLASDERMLPQALRGYAPDIHGVARTNARVTVRQGDQVIYETTVPPGEFLINDLYPSGYGGDLAVTVREADGSEQRFLVPYASVAQLLRPGSDRYSLTAGNLRSDYLRDKPALYQGTYQRGLTNALTGYAGTQLSQNYYALQVGAAVGTPVGAVSADVTQARAHLNNNGLSNAGQSYRLSYSKLISETDSNLALAAYRFSTRGYMDFMTAAQARDALEQGYDQNSIWRAKNRLTVTASQGLPGAWGQFYISSSLQNYWNKSGSDQQFQLGYSNRYQSLTYGINASRTQSGYGISQNNYQLTFSFPLGRQDQAYTPQMRLDFNRDSNGNSGQQATISGAAGSEHQFSYGVTGLHNSSGSSGSVNGQYRAPYSSLNASYSTGRNYHSESVGASGTLIAHGGGVTASPYVAETFALVEAKGASGARVSNYPGVVVDPFGYAVVPYLNPYEINEVSIDPKGTQGDVELENTTQRVAPYSGAVVKMKYQTRTGSPILIRATLEGQPVPFGADVIDSAGNSVGAVGQGGQVYARVSEQQGELRVKWGESAADRCAIRYQLMPQAKGRTTAVVQQFNRVCVPISSSQEG